MMKSHDDFVNELKEINDKIKIVGQYIGARNLIDCECLICGHKWSSLPTNLLRNHGCPNCDRLNRIKSKKEVYDFIEEEMPYVLLLDDFILREDNVKAYCTLCNYEWTTTPSELMQGKGCYHCGNKSKGEKLRFTNDEFIKKLKEINPYIQPLEKYITSHDRLSVQCLTCGHKWNPKPNNLFNGHGCPNCSSSFGERQVSIWLDNNKIKYESQKKYSDLLGTGNGLLSYDFYLPQYNLLIEYQGEFHDGTASQQTLEEFEIQKEHDQRKREYAKSHSIDLLEIWYWDFDNIEDILYNYLKKKENKKLVKIKYMKVS